MNENDHILKRKESLANAENKGGYELVKAYMEEKHGPEWMQHDYMADDVSHAYVDGFNDRGALALTERPALKTEVERLREAFALYGDHQYHCSGTEIHRNECTCGYTQARLALKESHHE